MSYPPPLDPLATFSNYKPTARAAYTCHKCGIEKRELRVTARAFDADIVDWIDKVLAPAIAEDHRKMSPGCSSRHCDIWLPANGEYLGQAVADA